MTKSVSLKTITGRSLIIMAIALGIFIMLTVVSQGATFLGGWSSEWSVATTPADTSYQLISRGNDTSLVVGFESYEYPDPDDMPDFIDPDVPTDDMTPPTGQPDYTGGGGTLTGNPFYPLVKAISDNTNIPVNIWWIILAWLIVIACMIASFRYAPHQLITAFVGGGLIIFFWRMGIFPFWVIFVYGIGVTTIVLYEREPSL